MKINAWDLYCFEEYPEEMEMIDVKEWKIDDFKMEDFISYISTYFNDEYDDVKHYTIHNIEGLFEDDIEFDLDKNFYTIQIDFFHPKMIRNVSFDYENFIKTRLKTISKSIKKIYKTKIFWLIDYINYISDPIAKIIIIIEDNLVNENKILTFEKFSYEIIGEKDDISTKIKNLKLSKDLKEEALSLLKQYTKAGKGKITGLQLHPLLRTKISEGGYPDGFDMGIDKNGYFIHTHRARSKSYESPDKIPVKDIKFINSTG